MVIDSGPGLFSSSTTLKHQRGIEKVERFGALGFGWPISGTALLLNLNLKRSERRCRQV
jgi:hypothetical protein